MQLLYVLSYFTANLTLFLSYMDVSIARGPCEPFHCNILLKHSGTCYEVYPEQRVVSQSYINRSSQI